MKKQAVAVGFVLFSFMLMPKASAASFDGLYVFGDSLSDTGNVYNGTGKTIPQSPPNFEGRFSNGFMWVDYLGNELGLKPTLSTNIDFTTIPPTPFPTQGINFAYGGSATGLINAANPSTGFPGLLQQVFNYAQTLQANNQTADPDALYSVWAGSNDFYFLDPKDSVTPVNNISLALNTLVGLGAKNFLVFNSRDLGKLPGASLDNRSPAILSQSTIEFNSRLAAAVNTFSQNQDINVIPVDIYSVFNQASALGFTNVTDACLFRPDICDPVNNTFLVWDEVHPTTRGHKLIADTALAAIKAKSVPEPSTELGALLAIATFSAVEILKRQQKRSVLGTAGLVFSAQLSHTIDN